MPRRWSRVAVCAVLVLAALPLALRARRTQPPAGNRWQRLEERTWLWARRGQSDSFRAVLPLLSTAAPLPGEFPGYSRVVLNTVVGLRKGAVGDPYPLIRRLERLARDQSVPDSGKRGAWFGLAREYLILRLPWRARSAISMIPPPLREDEAALRGAADRLWSATAPVPEPGAGPEPGESGRRDRELFQRILAMPAVTWPFAQDSAGALSIDEGWSGLSGAGGFLDYVLPVSREPLLVPLLSARREALEEYSALDYPAPVVTPELSGLARALYASTASHARDPGVNVPEEGREALARRLARSFGPRSTVESVTRQGNVLLVQLVTGGSGPEADPPVPGRNALLVAFEDRLHRFSARLFEAEDALGTELRDLTGDGVPDVVVMVRSGTGGFLDVDVIDPVENRTVWRATGLFHGDVLFLNADLDPASEILATRRGYGGCNQCEAPLEVSVMDYDPHQGRLVTVSRRHTAGSYHSGMLLFGVGPRNFLRFMDGRAQELLSRRPARLGDDDLRFLLGEYAPTLMDAGEFGRAENAMGSLEEFLRQTHAPAGGARALASVYRLRSALLGRGPGGALALAGDPALRSAIGTDSVALRGYHNVLSVAALASGNLDQGYRALAEQHRLGEEGSGFDGNLSWYYREVGAYDQAYDAAATALNRALSEENELGIVIDMVHLSITAYRLGRVDEAIDWSARAVGLARGLGLPADAALALTAAADLAIEEREPEIALRLLDEALMCADQPAWATLHSSILLLYGKALEQQGMLRNAAAAYGTSALPDGASRNSSEEAAALYHLSRLADRQGEPASALAYARAAFDAVNRGRQSIGVEFHKFSFLATQGLVTEWLLRNAVRQRADPGEILDILERSKMQVFLDLHGSFAGAPRTAGIAAELARALKPGELVLDYWVGDSASFVISVSSATGPRIQRLEIDGPRVRQLVAETRRAMDLRDPGALAAIRSDRPPAELSARLGELHAALIAPVAVPPGTRTLVIVPDGNLLGLPWPALRSADGRYLAERYATAVTPSLRMELAGLDARTHAGGPSRKAVIVAALGAVSRNRVEEAVGFARPEGVRALPLAPLRYGMREALSVGRALAPLQPRYLLDGEARRRFPGSIRGGAATPVAVQAAARDAAIVHVIAHGVFNDRAPMQSALFVEGRSASGRITAEDLAVYPLRGTELVSLSACQTGVSRAMPGAEQIGFVRGVLGSGAASVVLTEWEVDDAATAEFFTAFYENLSFSDRSGALQAARRAVMRRFRHPFYWAGVTLYGDWHRLSVR